MAHIPYIQINIAALCCFVLLLVAVCASRKTGEVKAFILVLAVLSMWALGSVLMRMQLFPGLSFWYYVSLIALFAIAPSCYYFVCTFVQEKATFTAIVFGIITLIVIFITPSGLFLAPPVPEALADGSVVFRYSMTVWLAVPCVLLLSIVASIGFVLKRAITKKGTHFPGLVILIAAQVTMFFGNILSILPGNVFPWDMLSGIICAVMIVWALYKKHMFNLNLLVSKTLGTAALVIAFIAASLYIVPPVIRLLTKVCGISESSAVSAASVAMAIVLFIIAAVLKHFMENAFSREKRMERIIRLFSADIARNLDIENVIRSTTDALTENLPINQAFICLPDANGFSVSRGSGRINNRDIIIAADSPCLSLFTEDTPWVIMDEFRRSPYFQGLWSEEKKILNSDVVSCLLPLNDEKGFVGLVFLGPIVKGKHLSYADLHFASTLASISAIAIKNASLYTEVFREARVDNLTGAYNYRYFLEQLDSSFHDRNISSLALIYIDIDDMRLYNQLYGVSEGDRVLTETVEIINRCIAGSGSVYRTSGKVFAILLPNCDERKAESISQEIQRLCYHMNDAPDKCHMKPVSICCGICVYPFAASTAKELMDNADIAVYRGKLTGKNTIQTFSHDSVIDAPNARAIRIVERNFPEAFHDTLPTVNALTAAIDAKDHYTFQHSKNVAKYSAILAAALGLSDDQILIVYEAGLLHDIGKISISENVLRKNDKLSHEEYEIIKTHVNNSIDMIRHISSMDYLIPAVVSHHERWDGNGYPRGISKTDIPLFGRCLAVADSFDAMTTDRPYRKGLGVEYACSQIIDGAGHQFDPELAYKFVELVKSGEISI